MTHPFSQNISLLRATFAQTSYFTFIIIYQRSYIYHILVPLSGRKQRDIKIDIVPGYRFLSRISFLFRYISRLVKSKMADSRFMSVDIDSFIEGNKNDNTKRKTKCDLSSFKQFLQEVQNTDEDVETIEPRRLGF